MQFTPNEPRYSRRQFAIYTPIGTEGVRIEGAEVVGRWRDKLEDFFGPRGRLLVEDFVNWPSEPEQIRRFTSLYAPLSWQAPIPGALPSPGWEFRFQIDNWLTQQASFRSLWKSLSTGLYQSTGLAGLSPADGFDIRGKDLVFRAGSLEGFLRMELLTCPIDRLRICRRPGCVTPYFVALHLNQHYCTPNCAKWGQAEVKKKWWEDKGEKWLKNRKQRKSIRRTQSSKKVKSERHADER